MSKVLVGSFGSEGMAWAQVIMIIIIMIIITIIIRVLPAVGATQSSVHIALDWRTVTLISQEFSYSQR